MNHEFLTLHHLHKSLQIDIYFRKYCFAAKKCKKNTDPKDPRKIIEKSSKSHCDLQVKGLLPHGRFIHAAGPRQVALEIQGMTQLPGHHQAGPRGSAAVHQI